MIVTLPGVKERANPSKHRWRNRAKFDQHSGSWIVRRILPRRQMKGVGSWQDVLRLSQNRNTLTWILTSPSSPSFSISMYFLAFSCFFLSWLFFLFFLFLLFLFFFFFFFFLLYVFLIITSLDLFFFSSSLIPSLSSSPLLSPLVVVSVLYHHCFTQGFSHDRSDAWLQWQIKFLGWVIINH